MIVLKVRFATQVEVEVSCCEASEKGRAQCNDLRHHSCWRRFGGNLVIGRVDKGL